MRSYLVNMLIGLALLWLGVNLVDDILPARSPIPRNAGAITLGWESYYPYQFDQGLGEARRQSGVDTEFLREAFQRAGYRLNLVDKDWATALEEVRAGTLQGVSLSFRTKEREQFAYFSVPYIAMRSALFFRRDSFSAMPATCEGLLTLLLRDKLSVSTTLGYHHPPQLQAVFEHPEVKPLLRTHRVEAESLRSLYDGEVDLVVADELGGMSLIMKNGWNRDIHYATLDLPARSSHVMLSKKSVPPEVVKRLDQAIQSMEADGSRAAIVRAYYYPTLLGLLAQGFLVDHISILATAAAALSGIFLARKQGSNLVGAFLLAAAPAAGGGLLRDVIAGRRPVAVVADPTILMTVLFMVLAGFMIFRGVEKLSPKSSRALHELDVDRHPVLVFFDSLGLAAFTVLGVLVAMQCRCEPLWLWGPLLAATTNGGGSMVRDILCDRPAGLVSSTIPYVEISVLWGLILSYFLIHSSARLPYQTVELQLLLLGTMIGVVLTRYLSLRLEVRNPTYGPAFTDEAASTQTPGAAETFRQA